MEQILARLRAFGQIFRSRYVRELENEIARLRAENRALLNSLLGTAGVPPLRVVEPAGSASFRAPRSGMAADVGTKAAPTTDAAPAVRKRSWQQLGRMLEIEEARREREHAAQMAAMRGRVVPGAADERPGGKPNGRG